jgi:branched-chain amino acid transport system ATP-binding protein
MTQPELIILDQTTEGLAPMIVAEIWRVIAQIRADGIATLIVDRDYGKVLANCDRALSSKRGWWCSRGMPKCSRPILNSLAF